MPILHTTTPPTALVLTFFLFTLAADIISTVEFDHTGDYLATGDKGGRVVLFERSDSVRVNSGVCVCTFHSKDN